MLQRNLVLGLLAFGCLCCGSDDEQSASELCVKLADTTCERLYECYSSEELAAAGLPASQASCKQMTQDTLGCRAATDNDLCEGSETFHSNQATRCIDQTNAASCNQIQDSDDFAPACELVCTVD